MTLKFKIGDSVEVSALVYMTRVYKPDTKVLSRIPVPPFAALVTGRSIRYEGQIDRGSSMEWGEYEPPQFTITKAHRVWLVRRGLTNKEEAVLESDMAQAWAGWDFPIRHAVQPKWDRDSRRVLREEMESVPRDAKGRWMKLEVRNEQAD